MIYIFSNVIRKILEDYKDDGKKVTQTELANMLGISKQYFISLSCLDTIESFIVFTSVCLISLTVFMIHYLCTIINWHNTQNVCFVFMHYIHILCIYFIIQKKKIKYLFQSSFFSLFNDFLQF